jgi:hypothetical protein
MMKREREKIKREIQTSWRMRWIEKIRRRR